MSVKRDYWINAIDGILADLDIDLTIEQIEAIADGAVSAADLYGEATGEPGWGGRFAEVERERDALAREAAREAAERPHRMAEAEARRTGKHVEDCYSPPWLTTTSPWEER